MPLSSANSRSTTADAGGPAVPRDLLVCPHCRNSLDWKESAGRAVCLACALDFPVHAGIPVLAVHGATREGLTANGNVPSASYEQAYQQVGAAGEYNKAYEEKRLKRWSTRREFQLLERLLGSQPRSKALLDLPCGGGRLSPVIGRHADLLIEADIGLGQLFYGRERPDVPAPRLFLSASAFHIPLRDASVDAVVCVRLCHHLPEKTEREKLFAELLRVAARFVIVTFFDHHSLKNVLRRVRRPFNGLPPKNTMTIEEVRLLATSHGARLAACPMLSPVGSGHRYALLVKEAADKGRLHRVSDGPDAGGATAPR